MPLEMIMISQAPTREQKSTYQPMMKMGATKSAYGGSKASKMNSMGYQSMPVQAAVKSTHTVEYRDVPTEPLNIEPQTILVEAMNIPLNILFQSKSSQLNLKSEHTPSKGSTQETQSEDEPHVLKHTVTKPILQTVSAILLNTWSFCNNVLFRFMKWSLQWEK